MRDRGKREVESYNNNSNYYSNNNNGECYAENFPEFPCKKHPSSASSSSGGICAYCLTDRLAQLVCQQCGEQRLSSSCACSCSEIFSNPAATDVGRISFLLENDQHRPSEISGSRPKNEQHRLSNYSNDEYISNNTANFRRSNSISTTAAATHHDAINNKGKKSETGKLWKIGRLFRKKRDNKTNNANKNSSSNYNSVNNNNEESYECNGVSRSRSLCSFRGFYDPEENGGFPVSNSAARASSVSTGNFMLDSAKRSCFSESEARISNFDYYDASNFVNNPNKNSNSSNNNNNNIFSLKETEFVSCDDPAFIDLKLNESNSNSSNNNNNNSNYYSNFNYSSNSMSDHYYRVPDLAAMRRSGLGLSTKEFGYRGGGHEDMLRNGGGSCRISDVSERDLRKVRKSYKVWKWFSKHNHTSTTSSKFDDHDFKS